MQRRCAYPNDPGHPYQMGQMVRARCSLVPGPPGRGGREANNPTPEKSTVTKSPEPMEEAKAHTALLTSAKKIIL